jgi:hypothetical protein
MPVAAFKRANRKRARIRWEQLSVNQHPGLLSFLTLINAVSSFPCLLRIRCVSDRGLQL